VARARIGQAGASLHRGTRDRRLRHRSRPRQRQPPALFGNGLFPAPIGGNFFTATTVQVRAGYDFDWWGKHRAQVAAALGELYARRPKPCAGRAGAGGGNVAQSYFRLQGAVGAPANLNSWRRAAALAEQGQAHRARPGQRTTNSACAEGNWPALQQPARSSTAGPREREALRALVGAGPDALADLRDRPLPSAPHALPAKLGIDLLARRPTCRPRAGASKPRSAASPRRSGVLSGPEPAGAIGLDARRWTSCCRRPAARC
jgi:multidrug efflux system outer membrane protein